MILDNDIKYNGIKVPSNLNGEYYGKNFLNGRINNILDESKYYDFGEPDSLEKEFIDKIYELYGNKKEKLKVDNLESKNLISKFVIKKIKNILPKDKLEELKNSIKFYPNKVELIVGYDKRKIVIYKNQVINIEKNFLQSLNAKNDQQPLSYNDIVDINQLLGDKLSFKDLFPYFIKENEFYWTSSGYDSHQDLKYYFDSNGTINYQSGGIKLKTIYKKI